MREVIVRFADADVTIQVTAIANLEGKEKELAEHNSEITALEMMYLGGLVIEGGMVETVLGGVN